jgi:hypothetical protein
MYDPSAEPGTLHSGTQLQDAARIPGRDHIRVRRCERL